MARTMPDKCYEVTEAMSTLSYAFYFFSHILYDKLEVVIDDPNLPVPTLATDGEKIYINSEFFKGLTQDQRLAAVAHEICHDMWMHPARMHYYRDHGLDGKPVSMMGMNYAADFIINDMLKQCGVGELHPSWLWRADVSYTESLEDVYRRIMPPDEPQPKKQVGQNGQSSPDKNPGDDKGQGEGDTAGAGDEEAGDSPTWGSGDPGESDNGEGYSMTGPNGVTRINPKGQFDKHLPKETDVAPSEWKATVEGAAMGAKAIGNLSAAMERFLSKFLEIPIDWAEVLADFIKARSGFDQRNMLRPNRRRLYQDRVYVPTRHSWQIEKVALIYDVSGSVSGAETALFSGTVLQVLEQCKPKELRCMCVNSEVVSDHTFESLEDFMDWQPTGSGGTDMEAGLRYLEEDSYEPDVCLILTDGYTHTDEDHEPSFPVLWVTTGAMDFAYGNVVKMDMAKVQNKGGQ